MPESNISQVINTHSRFIKNTHSNNINKQNPFILRRAVVVDVNRWPSEGGVADNISKSPYSINAVIIDQDIYNERPDLTKKQTWYPPLMPMNCVSVPEVGEEVFIIKENNIKSSIGYWIGRVNNSKNLDYFSARSWQKDPNERFVNGKIKTDEMHERVGVTPGQNDKAWPIPILDGDVLMQGRSGTYVRHSFDPLTKNAVLETGINLRIPKKNDISQPTIGPTRTKTLHYEKMKLSDISGDYKLFNKNFESYVTKGDKIKVSEGGYDAFILTTDEKDSIVNIAENHYNISINQSGNPTNNYLYRQVLGELNKETLEDIINVIKDLKEMVNILYTEYKDHVHEVPSQEFTYTKSIPADGGDVDIKFVQKIVDTKSLVENDTTYELDLSMEEIDSKFKDLNDRLDKTLSRTQFVQ